MRDSRKAIDYSIMKRFGDNKGLLDRKRFKRLEQEKRRHISELSLKRAVQLEEKLISSAFIREWRENFAEDKPVCLKKSIEKRRKR